MIASTDTPYRSAIIVKISPDFTIYVVSVGGETTLVVIGGGDEEIRGESVSPRVVTIAEFVVGVIKVTVTCGAARGVVAATVGWGGGVSGIDVGVDVGVGVGGTCSNRLGPISNIKIHNNTIIKIFVK